ncbi:MAG: archease [Candidatus Binataceae bacterium]
MTVLVCKQMSKDATGEIFREIEHTADLGIEVEADTRPELFRRAALAIVQLMADTAKVRDLEHRELSLTADNDADLMHDMLGALLQVFITDGFIWSDVRIEADDGLKVSLLGERFDPSRHEFYREIKAVTYHELSVQNVGGRWQARIIFDV